jgi:hypothetical protein
MPRVPTVRQADLARVIKALIDAGQGVARVIVRPGGVVEIVPGLTPPAPAPEPTPLDAWRGRKRGDHAAEGS